MLSIIRTLLIKLHLLKYKKNRKQKITHFVCLDKNFNLIIYEPKLSLVTAFLLIVFRTKIRITDYHHLKNVFRCKMLSINMFLSLIGCRF